LRWPLVAAMCAATLLLASLAVLLAFARLRERLAYETALRKSVAEREAQHETLVRLTHLYAALSETSHAVMRIADPATLFAEACRICVEHGNLAMAAVGLVDWDTHAVTIAASHGRGQSYLDGIEISTDPTIPEGCGPAGTAMREN